MYRSRILLITMLLSLSMPAVLWSVEDSSDRSSRPSSGATKSAPSKSASSSRDAEESSDLDRVERKMDDILEQQEQILANQQQIFQRFDAVMEELRIVKIRASQAR